MRTKRISNIFPTAGDITQTQQSRTGRTIMTRQPIVVAAPTINLRIVTNIDIDRLYFRSKAVTTNNVQVLD